MNKKAIIGVAWVLGLASPLVIGLAIPRLPGTDDHKPTAEQRGMLAPDFEVPTGTLVVQLVAARPGLEPNLAAIVSAQPEGGMGVWKPHAPATLSGFSEQAQVTVHVQGPYVAAPVTVQLPPEHGARLQVPVIPTLAGKESSRSLTHFAPEGTAPITVEINATESQNFSVTWEIAGVQLAHRLVRRGASTTREAYRELAEALASDVRELGSASSAIPGAAERCASPAENRLIAFVRVPRDITPAEAGELIDAIEAVARTGSCFEREASAFEIRLTHLTPTPPERQDELAVALERAAEAPELTPDQAQKRIRLAIAQCGRTACNPAVQARMWVRLGQMQFATGQTNHAGDSFRAAALIEPRSLDAVTRNGAEGDLVRSAREAPQPEVRLNVLSTSGTPTAEQTLAVLSPHVGQLRMCYVQTLADKPDLSGEIRLRFKVGRNGGAGFIERGEGQASAGMESCIAQLLGSATFPAPAKALTTIELLVALEPQRTAER